LAAQTTIERGRKQDAHLISLLCFRLVEDLEVLLRELVALLLKYLTVTGH
jgi:hypothetical protein